MAGLGVECPSAGDQLEFTRTVGAVHLLVRELCLLVHHHRCHLEGGDDTVGQIYGDLIAGLQSPQFEEHSGTLIGVHVAQNHGGTHLAGGRARREPSRHPHTRRHLDGPVGVQAQLGERYRQAEGWYPNCGRHAATTTAGGGTVGVVTTSACEVAARAEDTGRCGTGPAKGWRCSWSPATKHTAPTKRSNAVSTSNDLAMCSVAQWRVRPMLRPRDYESWFWRDGTFEARRRRMASTIVTPAAVNATPPAYTRAGFVESDAPRTQSAGRLWE